MISSVIFFQKRYEVKVAQQFPDGSLNPLGGFMLDENLRSSVKECFENQSVKAALIGAKFFVIFSRKNEESYLEPNVYHLIDQDMCTILSLAKNTFIGNLCTGLREYITLEKKFYSVLLDQGEANPLFSEKRPFASCLDFV